MALIDGKFPVNTDDTTLTAIRKLKFLDIEKGPWVAGGAVRNLLTTIQREGKVRDIDVFFPPEGDWSKEVVHDLLAGSLPIPSKITSNVISVDAADNAIKFAWISARNNVSYIGSPVPEHGVHDWSVGEKTVQCVFGRRFSTVEALFDDFDFTISMAATDGYRWVADERFFRDDEAKRLVLHNRQQRRFGLGRLRRYCFYGYTPEPGILSHMLKLDTEEMINLMNEKCVLPGNGNGS